MPDCFTEFFSVSRGLFNLFHTVPPGRTAPYRNKKARAAKVGASAVSWTRAGQRQILGQRIACAGKRQVVPGYFRRSKGPHLQGLVLRLQLAADHLGEVNDDHHRVAGVGVDIEEPRDLNFEIRLFPGLPYGRFFNPFSAIEESAREHPFAVARLDAAFEQDDPVPQGGDGTGGYLGVIIENEAAGAAHQPLRLDGLEPLAGKRTAALRAEAKLRTMVVMVVMGVSHNTASFPRSVAFLSHSARVT